MHLNEKIFTGTERESVVVFEAVGGLEVKGSVMMVPGANFFGHCDVV